MSGELPSSEEEVQALLESAVARRASHIRKEAETITMANVRRLLESDLGLEKAALDAHKVFIRQIVDAVLLSSDNTEAEEEEPVSEEVPKRIKKSSGKKPREENGSTDYTEEKGSEGIQVKDYEEAPRKKKQKKEKAKKEDSYSKDDSEESSGSHAEASVSVSEEEVHLEASKGKSQKSKPRKEKEEKKEVDENGGGSHSEMSEEDSDVSDRRKAKKASSKVSSIVRPVQNRRIEHLKKIIKACGLTIPPQIYKRAKQQPDDKHDKYLIKELEDLLSRRGLSADPSEKEIKAAKRKIAREKDMEGIDTTNIILEPRGRRAASQLFAPVYNPPPVEYDSELDDDGEQDEEEESDNGADGSEDEEKDLAAADDTDNSE